jgi:gliding motility-associated-like protein
MSTATELKKTLLILLCSFMLLQTVSAKHIAGGEMRYTYLGPGTDPNSGSYRISLRLYRDCNAPAGSAELEKVANFTIYQNGVSTVYKQLQVNMSQYDINSLGDPGPCINNPPIVCYQVGTYTVELDLPFTANGYTIAHQGCCRIGSISNVIGSSVAGYTYVATIPGTAILPLASRNSSPVFRGSDTVLICENNAFTYDFSAIDKESDSLAYVFDTAYEFDRNNPLSVTAKPPPYSSLAYSFGFSAGSPMGPDVKLDARTGLMSGIAPLAGIYVVTVSVLEYRQGILINRHRKDLHIKVADCSIAAASLDPVTMACDGYTVTLQNNNNSPLITSHDWTFTGPGNFMDSSAKERPVYTFPDTGIYRIRLITNRGKECSDTGYSIVKVYPGFRAGFMTNGACRNVPISFTDTSRAAYGQTDSWQWTFGYPLVNQDSSRQKNPVYTYPVVGTFPVRLIVSSNKGCQDTVDRQLIIADKPLLTVSNDTLICHLDSIRLRAVGSGSFSWWPSTGLSDAAVADPMAKPLVPTMYHVKVTASPGCENSDSVFIDLKKSVTLEAGNDTTICLTDTIRLKASGDGLAFRWQPDRTLDNPFSRNPLARPDGTTRYRVTASIGSCTATDSLTVFTAPYPMITLSDDTTICFGDSVRLRASGGNNYLWRPSESLSDNRIPDPLAYPLQTTLYRVDVSNSFGCPKIASDSVRVTVIPRVKASAGNDTSIVRDQPLKLKGSGGITYQWTPSTGLNDPNIPDPTAILDSDITYLLKVTGAGGCAAYDSVRIKVFRTGPDIFVPTAFTPNGDRLNDILTPITAGITKLEFFRVYDRWGKLVFSTTEFGKGWDGRNGGSQQANHTYVWHVRGIDFTGRIIDKKGTSTLIR